MFVRAQLVVPNDAEATASNILNHSFLYRIGFASDLLMAMCDIGVALLFYFIFKATHRELSLTASAFRFAQAIIISLNLLNFYLPLLLLGEGITLPHFSEEQLQSLSLIFLQAHAYGYLISAVCFGISCIITGWLMIRTRQIFPKWLGVIVAAAGISYLSDSGINFLLPDLASTSELLLISIAAPSEILLCAFLMFKGRRGEQPH